VKHQVVSTLHPPGKLIFFQNLAAQFTRQYGLKSNILKMGSNFLGQVLKEKQISPDCSV